MSTADTVPAGTTSPSTPAQHLHDDVGPADPRGALAAGPPGPPPLTPPFSPHAEVFQMPDEHHEPVSPPPPTDHPVTPEPSEDAAPHAEAALEDPVPVELTEVAESEALEIIQTAHALAQEDLGNRLREDGPVRIAWNTIIGAPEELDGVPGRWVTCLRVFVEDTDLP